MLLGAVLAIVLVILSLVFKDKIFGSSGSPDPALSDPLLSSGHYTVERPKQIDVELFNSEKFKGLSDNQAYEPALEELEVGKPNPFAN